MKNYNFNSKLYLSFVLIFLCSIFQAFGQIEMKPDSKLVKKEINLKNTGNHPNAHLFNKIKVINNVNYSNYVYTFYTKNNRIVKGSVKKVGDGFIKVKILEGYKEHKYMFLPFDSISHFQEHYSGE